MNRILIIDDDKTLCELIKRSVQAENIEADFCNTGKEGLQKLREHEYQLVVLDVMMPVMDGLEAARYIRWSNKENARDIPIIAMTANAFTEDRRRVLEAGMNEHLAKPLESEVLIKTIANYCGKVDHFK